MSTTYNSIDELIKDIRRKRVLFAQKVLDLMNEESIKTIAKTQKEFGAYQQERIRQIFTDAIQKFYADYTPSMYPREGDDGHGLYDILDMQVDEDGGVVYGEEYMGLFDREKMHRGRERDTGPSADLFEKVFIEGWHGGALGISSEKSGVWGKHPRRGRGYYRTAGMITLPDSGKSVWHKWGAWGKEAKKMNPSPYKLISKNIDIAEKENGEFDNMCWSILLKHNDEAMERVKNAMPSIAKDVL